MAIQVTARLLRNQAVCDCGWRGKHRWFHGAAVVDAHLHAAAPQHLPPSGKPGDGGSAPARPEPSHRYGRSLRG